MRGYRAEQIQATGVRFVENSDWASRNSVDSLMKARHELTGDCLVCYSDLVYDPSIVAALAGAPDAIGVAVDTAFAEYWQARWGSSARDSESLALDARGRIRSIGAPDPPPQDVHGRFVGMLRFDAAGVAAFKAVYDDHARSHAGGGPWYHARSFETAAMTDMCQALIDAGVEIGAVPIERGWVEVDTAEDRSRYERWMRDGGMQRFCRTLGTREGDTVA